MATTIRDCKTIQPLLSEYVDGTLPEETTWSVKLHCAGCAVCSRITDDFTATANLLRTLPQAELSSSFESKLAMRLADISLAPPRRSAWTRLRENMNRVWMRPHARPAFAMGAALAAVLPASVVILSRQTHPTPTVVRVAPARAANDVALRDLWRDHAAFSASEPLGDHASVIASSREF